MLIRKKSLKIQERLGMRIGVAYGSSDKPVVKTAGEALNVLETFYKVGFRAFLLPQELFSRVGNISDLYKEHYTNLLKIKTIASKYNIELAIHNNRLPGEPQLDETLKIYCNIANVMDVRSLIIHPTFYKDMPKDQALRLTVYKINETVRDVRVRFKIGIETTGKEEELGNFEEVLDIVKRTYQTEPILNWAHIHARPSWEMTAESDFRKILSKIKEEIGMGWVKEAYFIFSGMYRGPSGAIKHRPIIQSDMKLEHLVKNIQAMGMKGTLIFETPNREKDILDILEQLGDMVR